MFLRGVIGAGAVWVRYGVLAGGWGSLLDEDQVRLLWDGFIDDVHELVDSEADVAFVMLGIG